MHVDKSSGVNHNQDNIELQQQVHQSQQSSIFGDGFPDKNNNGIVDYEDFNDDTVFEKLKKENLLGSFWGDVYDKVNDIVHFSDKKIEVNTEVLCKTERKDGYEIRIVSANGSQPVLQIQAKDKPVVNIKIDFFDEDANNEQKQTWLQALFNGLNELKTEALQDLSQEIGIFYLRKYIYDKDFGVLGRSTGSSIDLAMNMFPNNVFSLSDVIVHEIGHAIDEKGYLSTLSREYHEKFERFDNLLRLLLEKYNCAINISMIGNYAEDFACRYASIVGGSEVDTADIDKFVNQFENSNDEKERQCYESHKKLYNLAQDCINQIRQLSREERSGINYNNKPKMLHVRTPEEIFGPNYKEKGND